MTRIWNTLKRITSLALALVMVFALLPTVPLRASAESASAIGGEAGDCAWSFDEATGLLTVSGSGSMGDYGTYSQVPWDDYRSKITSVKLEEGVTNIAPFAFYACRHLTSLTIPSSVTSIGKSAFNQSGLTTVTIPDSVTAVGDSAFSQCVSLTGAVIGNGVSELPHKMFYTCSALTSVIIGEKVYQIDSTAFSSCSALADVTYLGTSEITDTGIFSGTAVEKVKVITDYYYTTLAGKPVVPAVEVKVVDIHFEMGTVTVPLCYPGETVTVTPVPTTGYRLSGMDLTFYNGDTKTELTVDGAAFTVPEECTQIDIVPYFELDDYTVTIAEDQKDSLTADKTTAKMGEPVTLTVTLPKGYLVKYWRAEVTDGVTAPYITPYEDSVESNGSVLLVYAFEMPGSDVAVSYVTAECDHAETRHTTATDNQDNTHTYVCTYCFSQGQEHHSATKAENLANCQRGAICDLCGASYDNPTINNHDPSVSYVDGYCPNGCFEPATDVDGDGIYEIGNAGQLYWFAKQVNGGNTTLNAKLTAHITVNQNVLNADGELSDNYASFRVWDPIGVAGKTYTGTFDGCNYTVSGLYLNDPESSYNVGLFGWLDKGTVKNVGVADSYISAVYCVGGVVGYNQGGKVINCYNAGTVVGSQRYVGGVVGGNTLATAQIIDCCNTGLVINTGTYSVSQGQLTGGVAGVNFQGASISGCYNTGMVISSANVANNTGGVIGQNASGTVTNSYNTGTVKGNNQVGGIAGTNWGTLSNCYSIGSVEGNTLTGGILGHGSAVNCYYLTGTASGGINGKDVEGQAEAKTVEEFASGQVAHLLQGSQSDLVWGQILDLEGQTPQDYPALQSAKVYSGYIDCGDLVYSNRSDLNDEPAEHTGTLSAPVPTADGTQHTATWSCCGVTVTEPHSTTADGDKAATCQVLAYCSVCQSAYGKLGAHVFADGKNTCSVCDTEATMYATDGTATYYAADAESLKAAVTKLLDSGATDITAHLTENADTTMFSAIAAALAADGIADCSIDLTISGAKKVPEYAFSSSKDVNENWRASLVLREVTLTDATAIASGAFYGCSMTRFSAPKVIAINGSYAIGFCKQLTDVDLPSVQTLESYVFGECYALKTVSLPECVDLGDNTFIWCEALETVYVPKATNLGALDFMLCTSLTKVTLGSVESVNQYYETIANGLFSQANDTQNIELILACDQKALSFDSTTKYWTSTDEAFDFGNTNEFIGYTFKSITTAHSPVADDGDCTTDVECSACGGIALEAEESHVTELEANKATCQKQAVCDLCNTSYGEVDKANHDPSVEYANGFCPNGCYEPATDANSDGIYEIANAGQLFWFAQLVNSGTRNLNAVLTADIDLEGRTWAPIAQTASYHASAVTDTGYTGIFDGQNRVVRNFKVECETGNGGSGADGNVKSYGLFGTVSGTVKNLGIDGFSFDSTAEGKADCRVGGIAGQLLTGGTIENCYTVNSVILTGSRIAGGIAGCSYGGTIQNCLAYGNTVTGHERCAAIVGDTKDDSGGNIGYVTNCYADKAPVGSQNGGADYVTSCEQRSAEQFASGEVAYKLNGDQSVILWKQTIGQAAFPSFSGEQVYQVTNTGCQGNIAFGNDPNGSAAALHCYPDGCNGFCANLLADGTACDVYQAASDTDSDGVYEIGNAGQLYWFAAVINGGYNGTKQDLAANAILTADIVINDHVLNTDGSLNGDGSGFREWIPIGNSYADGFTGSFDGKGHSISGLYFNNGSATGVGLFGRLNGGAVSNVGVKDSFILGKQYVGGIVGSSNGGTVSGCYHSGTVNGYKEIGGVVGYNNDNSTVTDCYNTGKVSASSSWVGGIVGYNYSVISGCYNSGPVSADETGAVGGIVGSNRNSGSVSNCYNTGAVSSANNFDVAGVAAYNYGSITNCYNTGDVKANGRCGGVVSFAEKGTVSNCYSTGAVSAGNGKQAGVAAYLGSDATISNCYYNGDVFTGGAVYDNEGTVINTEGKSTSAFTGGEVAHLLQGSQTDKIWGQNLDNGQPVQTHPVLSDATVYFGYVNCTEVDYTNNSSVSQTPLSHSYDNGFCTTVLSDGSVCGAYQPADDTNGDGVYEIGNAGQLYWFAAVVNGGYGDVARNMFANAVLTGNITVNEAVLNTDGSLGGSGYRDWHPIGNGIDGSYSGSFDGKGYTVSGLYADRSDTDYQGLFGYAENGSITDVGVKDSYIRGKKCVGGVVGCALGCSISGCFNSGTVTGEGSVGGIVGDNTNSRISGCYNTGSISANSDAGGVAGFNWGLLENCYNTGKISANSNAGGVAGNSNVQIINCYNTGIVTGNAYVGGVVGHNSNYAPVDGCHNTGTVSGENFVGGVAGFNYCGNIIKCYNTASVTATGQKAGGVVGDNHGQIQYCYNRGEVSSSEYAGGIVGSSSSFDSGTVWYIMDCYNTGRITSYDSCGAIVGMMEFTHVSNCYYLIGTAPGGINSEDIEGQAEPRSVDQFASGEITYLLNHSVSNDSVVWRQTLAEEHYPRLTGKVVYHGYGDCRDTAVCYHNNSRDSSTPIAHLYDTEGFCSNLLDDGKTVCGMYQPAADTNGDGVYEIGNPGQLYWFGQQVNGGDYDAWAVLTADLDLKNRVWNTITSTDLYYDSTAYSGAVYTGTFDGQGHVIKNYTVKGTNGTKCSVGLFGTAMGATVRNLGVDNMTFQLNGATDVRAAAIIGQMLPGTTVENCYAVNSTLTPNSYIVGGIAACNYGGTIRSCFTYNVAVSGHERCGNLVSDTCGDMGDRVSDRPGTVENCYTDAARIAGTQSGGLVTGCQEGVNGERFASGEITWLLNGSKSAGIWKQTIGTDAHPKFTGSTVYYGYVDCQSQTMTYNNRTDSQTPPHSYNDNGFCTNSTAEGTLCDAYEPAALNGDVYEIRNAGQLYWFAAQVNGGSNDINGKLMKNILVNQYVLTEMAKESPNTDAFRVWTPIGIDSSRYAGTFDGQSFTVSGLYFHDSESENIGLFGYANRGTVQNVGVVDSWLHAYGYVGGVVGESLESNVINCWNAGRVSGIRNVGGVVARNDSGNVTGCRNAGIVEGVNSVGGVVGNNMSGSVTDCFNTAAISGNASLCGGAVGYNYYGTVTNCYNTGSISGGSYVGGVTGQNFSGTVTNCYNSGTVSGNRFFVGGVAGENQDGTVTNCYYLTGCAMDGDETVQLGVGNIQQGSTTADVEGSTTPKTSAQFASGEVTYLLQGEQTEQLWGQNLDNGEAIQTLPAFSDAKVYGVTGCNGTTVVDYSNTQGLTDHSWGEPEYIWNAEYTELLVTLTCQLDGSHTVSGSTTDITVDNTDPLKTVYTGTATVNGKEYTGSAKVDNRIHSVAISWGEMSFTYTDEGGWTSGETGWVQVENTGEAELTVTPTYTNLEGFDFQGSFTDENGAFTTFLLEIGDTRRFMLILSGRPNKVLREEAIGEVTLTIE